MSCSLVWGGRRILVSRVLLARERGEGMVDGGGGEEEEEEDQAQRVMIQ